MWSQAGLGLWASTTLRTKFTTPDEWNHRRFGRTLDTPGDAPWVLLYFALLHRCEFKFKGPEGHSQLNPAPFPHRTIHSASNIIRRSPRSSIVRAIVAMQGRARTGLRSRGWSPAPG